MGVYWAMTHLELLGCPQPPAGFGWLSCHLSSADCGLSNLPDTMPAQGLLCIDDSLLPDGHDAFYIARQAAELSERLSLAGVVLDFQRPYDPQLHTIAREIQKAVPCPVATTPGYAQDWPGAVFLPPVPLNQCPGDYFSPWKGRELWLELGRERLRMVLTEDGCQCFPGENALGTPVFYDHNLYCHYHIELNHDCAVFTLERSWEDSMSLTEDGRQYGVTNAIALYQEFYLSTAQHTVG